jgi:KRAB domain-containing zinc finger protein
MHVKDVHDKIKDIECKYCGMEFASQQRLTSHVNQSHNDKKDTFTECERCGKKIRALNLKQHINKVHLNIKRFKCDSCEFKAYDMCKIRNHNLAVHNTVRDFKCIVCKKAFKTRRDMLKHRSFIHGTGNTLDCKFCFAKFTTPAKLAYHIKGQHNKSSVIIAECELCGKKVRSHNLQKHINEVHKKITPFTCKFCPKKFSQKSNLKKHEMRYHLDAKDGTIKKEVSLPNRKIVKVEPILEEPKPIVFKLITDFKLEITDDLRPDLVSNGTHLENDDLMSMI